MLKYGNDAQPYNKLCTQDSADSNLSNQFADLSSGNRERQNHYEKERYALIQLKIARDKPVAFAVKTMVEYDGSSDDESPVLGYAISFQANEYIHVKEKYDELWWIGRLVKAGCDVGFIPSPQKLEILKIRKLEAAQARGGNKIFSYPKTANEILSGELLASNQNELHDAAGSRDPKSFSAAHLVGKKKLGKAKCDMNNPYEVVPTMRPLVLIGPSLKGYEVTDMMQKALFDFLKKRFEGRIIMTKVAADLSQGKKRSATSGGNKFEKTKGNAGAAEAQEEIERIFELASSMQLIVLDCDTINHPVQLSKTNLAPYIAYIKISNSKVLLRLIKSRGKHQSKLSGIQMSVYEKLNQCSSDMFDIILDHYKLDVACDHLAKFLEKYWEATHPPTFRRSKLSNPRSRISATREYQSQESRDDSDTESPRIEGNHRVTSRNVGGDVSSIPANANACGDANRKIAQLSSRDYDTDKLEPANNQQSTSQRGKGSQLTSLQSGSQRTNQPPVGQWINQQPGSSQWTNQQPGCSQWTNQQPGCSQWTDQQPGCSQWTNQQLAGQWTNQRLASQLPPMYQGGETWDSDLLYSPPAELNNDLTPGDAGLPHPFHKLYVTNNSHNELLD